LIVVTINTLNDKHLLKKMKHYCLTCRDVRDVDYINMLVACNDYDRVVFKCHTCGDYFDIWTDYFHSKEQRDKNEREKNLYIQETSCGGRNR
jgi:hypothetical protein